MAIITVRDSGGVGIEGVGVAVLWTTDGMPVFSGLTDVNGQVDVTVGVGTYIVYAVKVGYETQNVSWNGINALTITLVAGGPVVPVGKITALRVQRLDTNEWFNWDNGAWDVNGAPKIALGQSIYVAAYCINVGDTGPIDLQIRDPYGTVLQSVSLDVASGEGMGIELLSYTVNYTQSLSVTATGDSVPFTVRNEAEPDGGIDLIVPLVIIGGVFGAIVLINKFG